MGKKRMLLLTACAALAASITPVNAQDGRVQRAVRPFVRARADAVTVDIRVHPMARSDSPRTQRPTRLPDSDWSCLAQLRAGRALELTCTAPDMHSLSLTLTQCEAARLTLGGAPGSTTYYLRAGCD